MSLKSSQSISVFVFCRVYNISSVNNFTLLSFALSELKNCMANIIEKESNCKD